MMHSSNSRLSSVLFATALLTSGCGGGGGGDSAPAASGAQGLWIGTTSPNRTVTGLVLTDGTFYVLYSLPSNASVIAGVIQGTGTASAGTFSSSDARDFNLEGFGVLPATVTANYVSKQSFNGTITYPGIGSAPFTSTYDPSYETTPSLAALAGTYTGQVAFSLGVQAAVVTISSGGAITGGGSGCAISGSAAPRSDGNAFNLSITFGASPCFFANQTFSGIGYFNSVAKRLYAAAPNSARSDGVLFVGTKP